MTFSWKDVFPWWRKPPLPTATEPETAPGETKRRLAFCTFKADQEESKKLKADLECIPDKGSFIRMPLQPYYILEITPGEAAELRRCRRTIMQRNMPIESGCYQEDGYWVLILSSMVPRRPEEWKKLTSISLRELKRSPICVPYGTKLT